MYQGPGDQRPFVCRMFGASVNPILKCKHGCRPKVLLTKKQSSKLMKRYLRLNDKV